MPGGDFSQEAYDQLREAYAKESEDQRTAEEKGFDIMGLNLGLETAPVDSPWADKIPNWSYPDGKSQYLDKHQDPAEILQLMRDAAQERVDDSTEESDGEEEEEVEETEEDTGEEEVEVSEEEETEDDEEDEEDEDEDEDEDEVDEEETLPDPSEISAAIAELRSELEQMQFVTDSNDDEP